MLDQVLISFVLMGGCLFFVCLFQLGDAQNRPMVAGNSSNLRTIPPAVESRRSADNKLDRLSVDEWENEGGAARGLPSRMGVAVHRGVPV